VWVLVVVPLMVVSMLLMVISLPRLIGTAWVSVGAQWGQLTRAGSEGDILGVMARGLAIVALVLPLLGIALVVGRLVRRLATGVWQRTAGRPVRRGIALLLAAALVAGLAWAWWPTSDHYRPVHAYEGGTVLDAVPAGHSTGLAAGRTAAATTIWPADAGALPTPDHPALALVMTPRAGSGAAANGGTSAAPTWVFPFDRPLPPKAGDNQALAVNTTNGSVQYDVSFALVWATGDTALNKNEAYAFASCTGCRTVAVAFQVVLVAGSVHVAVPQNLSGAVNYACVQCVTYALATQLVVSVDGPLSDAADRQLAAVWAELQAFGRHIQDVPLAELQARLTDFENRIKAIVTQDAGGGSTSTESSATAPESGSSPATGSDAGATDPGTAGATTDAARATPTDSAPTSSDAAAPTSDTAAVPSATESAAATSASSSPTG